MPTGFGTTVEHTVEPSRTFNSGGLSNWSVGRASLARMQSPFLDYASTQIPRDVVDIWRWCTFFAIKNPLVSAALYRKSSYPVTDLRFQHKNEHVADAWRKLLEQEMRLTEYRISFNMDMYTYGRGAFSVFPPFRKYLKCLGCGKQFLAQASKFKVNPTQKSLDIICPTCGRQPAITYDLVLNSPLGFKIRRWAPSELVCIESGFMGNKTYYVSPALWLKSQIKRGVPSAIINTPQEIVDCILRDKVIRIDPHRIFVREEPGSKPSVDTQRNAWPFGTLVSVLSELYLLQVAYKNEEVALITGMLPFRALAPEPSNNPAADVLTLGVYDKWSTAVREEYNKFIEDPGYISILPVSLRNVQTATNPNPMLPKDPITQHISNILAGINVPQSVVIEGAPWSGAIPQLKLFEKDGQANQNMQSEMVDFIVSEAQRYLRWATPTHSLGAMMSVEAIQRIGAYSQLVSSGQLDQQSFHESVLNMDHATIRTRLKEEADDRRAQQAQDQMANADIQARIARDQAAAAPQLPAGQEGAPPPQEGGQPPQEGAPVQPGAEEAPTGPTGASLPQPVAASGLPSPQQVMSSYPTSNAMTSDSGRVGLSGSHFSPEDIIESIPANPGPDVAARIVDAMEFHSPQNKAYLMQQISQRYPTLARMILDMQDNGGMQAPLPQQLPPRMR